MPTFPGTAVLHAAVIKTLLHHVHGLTDVSQLDCQSLSQSLLSYPGWYLIHVSLGISSL